MRLLERCHAAEGLGCLVDLDVLKRSVFGSPPAVGEQRIWGCTFDAAHRLLRPFAFIIALGLLLGDRKD